MRKSIFCLASALMLCLACNKEGEETISEVPQITPAEPAGRVFTADECRERFRRAANDLMDQINLQEIQNVERSITDLISVDFDEVDGDEVLGELQSILESLTTVQDSSKRTVLNLYAFRGNYVMSGKKVTKTPAENITASVNGRWTLTVDFSQETVRIPVFTAKKEEVTLVDLPRITTLTLTDFGTQIAKLKLDVLEAPAEFEHLLNEKFNPDTDYLSVSVSATVASYTVSIAKIEYKSRGAYEGRVISRNGQPLITEEIRVGDIRFEDEIPSGAGQASLSLDILGEIQIKATTPSVDGIIEATDLIRDYMTRQEAQMAADSFISKFDTGVYFGDNIKQACLGMDVFQGVSSYYFNPVIVLSDGSRFEDPTGFFTQSYFESVINRAYGIINSIEENL